MEINNLALTQLQLTELHIFTVYMGLQHALTLNLMLLLFLVV